MAGLDGFRRSVVSSAVSRTWAVGWCVEAWERAWEGAPPEMLNREQGAPWTSLDCTHRLEAAGIPIRMDGWGRALETICVARLGRTVTDEAVYLPDDQRPNAAASALKPSFAWSHRQRWHQALASQTPAMGYCGG